MSRSSSVQLELNQARVYHESNQGAWTSPQKRTEWQAPGHVARLEERVFPDWCVYRRVLRPLSSSSPPPSATPSPCSAVISLAPLHRDTAPQHIQQLACIHYSTPHPRTTPAKPPPRKLTTRTGSRAAWLRARARLQPPRPPLPRTATLPRRPLPKMTRLRPPRSA